MLYIFAVFTLLNPNDYFESKIRQFSYWAVLSRSAIVEYVVNSGCNLRFAVQNLGVSHWDDCYRTYHCPLCMNESDLRSDVHYSGSSESPYRPEFFSGLIFTTAWVVHITAKITFIHAFICSSNIWPSYILNRLLSSLLGRHTQNLSKTVLWNAYVENFPVEELLKSFLLWCLQFPFWGFI